MTLGGIILCGGRSSRMGRAKAWLPIGDETMLARVARVLGSAARPIVVVAAPGQEVPPLPADIMIVRDAAEGRGPLQGLAAGLEALPGLADAAYLSSCDVPFLQPAWVRRLRDLLGDHHICMPRVGEFLQPLAAIYRLEVLPTVQRLLVADRRRLIDLCAAAPTRTVTAAELADIDPTLQTLRNLNTPADYAAALRDFS